MPIAFQCLAVSLLLISALPVYRDVYVLRTQLLIPRAGDMSLILLSLSLSLSLSLARSSARRYQDAAGEKKKKVGGALPDRSERHGDSKS